MARPCKFKSGEREPWREGIFHRWGDAWVYGNGDERIPQTIAIAEDYEEGRVFSTEPDHILFVGFPDPADDSEEARQWTARMAEINGH